MSNVIARCGRYLSDLLLGEIVAKGAGARLRSQDRNPRPENNNHKIRRKQKERKNRKTTPQPPTINHPSKPEQPDFPYPLGQMSVKNRVASKNLWNADGVSRSHDRYFACSESDCGKARLESSGQGQSLKAFLAFRQ
ncbi:uncharacterized protein CPUR_07041 [Claviceps purpurea 20.1]|uniref:Uncharacterized protein n=1 Tax=Claviceps purpurea (strain 20.1) TaxID=1111077 RepID=M1WEW4_CLAP2|nr:uncharacterized protein CPUR_07041 [Claviceps purpurea 20.1]